MPESTKASDPDSEHSSNMQAYLNPEAMSPNPRDGDVTSHHNVPSQPDVLITTGENNKQKDSRMGESTNPAEPPERNARPGERDSLRVTEENPSLRASSAPPSEHDALSAVRTLLLRLGEDPSRPGLIQTPQRFTQALQFLTSGYSLDPHVIANNAIFEVGGGGDGGDDGGDGLGSCEGGLVLVRDIHISSLCEHHLLPFVGRLHVGYVPGDGRVLGLSKLARIADVYARRLQVQERLTAQVAGAIEGVLRPRGVVVVVECEHMCMAIRGVRRVGATTVTECKTGVFLEDGRWGEEFHRLLGVSRR